MRRAPRQAQYRSRRSGATLLLFAILLFILFPLTALVIDLGLASLARRQMQTAVNTAALEGLRFRDDVLADHRENAARLGEAVFDDNLNSDADDAMQFGAGPVIEYGDGIALDDTDFQASRPLAADGMGVYKPVIDRNPENEPGGDLVAGSYVVSDDVDAHQEQVDYSRKDFLPAPAAEAPTASAFLARLRRTGETVEGGSSGPRLPWVFGRVPDGGSDFLDSRERGIAVRATAIAAGAPAKTIWFPNSSLPSPPGIYSSFTMANFWLDGNFWVDGSWSSPNDPPGADDPRLVVVQRVGDELWSGGTVVGRVFNASFVDSSSPTATKKFLIAGQLAADFPENTPTGASMQAGVVPLMADVQRQDHSSPDRRIVGFGQIISLTAPGPTITLTRPAKAFIAGGNVSANYYADNSAGGLTYLNQIDVKDLSAKCQLLGSGDRDPPLVQAPALQRAVD